MLHFFRKIKITYGITVCNEAVELNALLSTIIPFVKKNDEIIVLRDITNADIEVANVLKKHEAFLTVVERKLNNNFSEFKNTLITVAKGDYLFQIDADEIPQQNLLKKLRYILQKKYRYDCFSVPRINTVEGIKQEHIEKWNWKLNEKGYINYPDYQMRIFKLNKGIHWVNKVHEELTGYNRLRQIKADHFDLCLLHHKKIEKQKKQNEFYDKL
ncbi:MAG TPA: glycosyltransferase [Niabella sp.]|nr:glycosyltransferase [Niabella sp.]